MVTIIVATEAADVPMAIVSAVVSLFRLFFDGTTISHPGSMSFLLCRLMSFTDPLRYMA